MPSIQEIAESVREEMNQPDITPLRFAELVRRLEWCESQLK
jgi:hypothetical protein